MNKGHFDVYKKVSRIIDFPDIELNVWGGFSLSSSTANDDVLQYIRIDSSVSACSVGIKPYAA
jgi:hypothetical protein